MIPADFDVSKSIGLMIKCWEQAQKNYALILGASILSFILHKVVSVIPLVGFVLSPVIAVLLYAGILRMTKIMYNNDTVNFDDLFYFFKIIYERNRLINLGLFSAVVIFVFRMLFFVVTLLNPFTSGVEFFVGIFESFTLFFVSLLILPEMIFRGHEINSAFQISLNIFKSYWLFFLSLLLINWLFATASALLLVIPFFLIYLPTVAFLPVILNEEMKTTVY